MPEYHLEDDIAYARILYDNIIWRMYMILYDNKYIIYE